MGRQSSRIYFNQKDHKEMVTWDGSKFVYHDKAYIWNNGEFELVWEKLYGLKLLYESTTPFNPVSSENNKYLYWTENDDGSIIYRLVVNAREPEKEEWYTSNKYTVFTAPVSSRGFGIHAEWNQYGYTWDYRILNLDTGGVYKSDTFDASEYLLAPNAINVPTYNNQQASPALSELNYQYASIFSSSLMLMQQWNFYFSISPAGITASMLDNREGDSTYINPYYVFDLGRLVEETPRGLLPRFLKIIDNGQEEGFSVGVFEYGAGTQYGYYSLEFSDPLPFEMGRVTGGGLNASTIKVVRDGKLPMLPIDKHIWIVQANRDDFTFIETGIESPSNHMVFDISPDFKYAMIFEDLNFFVGTKIVKIVDMETKKVIVNINEEIKDDFIPTNAYFVGHKCIFMNGVRTGMQPRYRLYKWR